MAKKNQFMKNFIPFVLTFLFLSVTLKAQKDTCHVGVYVNNIFDFKVEDKSYMADFWLWMNYTNDSLTFENVPEIANSKTADFSHYSKEKKGKWNWATQKCRAQLIHQWDVSRFPFDKQLLQIVIEDSQYDTSALIYLADKANSKLDNSINSTDWTVEHFSIKECIKIYQTTYGNPALSGRSSYPAIVVEIAIKRNNCLVSLLKMLTGVYVAFFISCMVFFISSENQDSRFGLCVGGIFAAIGNKYIVESIVPSSSNNTLLDNVHTLTFVFILIIIILITISLNYFESGSESKKQVSLKIDKYAFYILTILYVFINFLLVYKAAR